ncbi:hypothetical protein GIB67_031423 [Kingdonia uniflora]|uniref:Uncharacterized protein n=1 Tax=Kingdonia uniflora TaxID=39325 RepID=A0A7J7MB40_9MAGN|nr:hypothetical protein GIB67_031423 [Kingdonia uniflora]
MILSSLPRFFLSLSTKQTPLSFPIFPSIPPLLSFNPRYERTIKKRAYQREAVGMGCFVAKMIGGELKNFSKPNEIGNFEKFNNCEKTWGIKGFFQPIPWLQKSFNNGCPVFQKLKRRKVKKNNNSKVYSLQWIFK